MSSKKRVFSEDFKKQAVELAEVSDKSLAKVAKELGVGFSTLTRWKKQYGGNNGNRKARAASQRNETDVEVIRLKRELERLKKENEILKKATAFFAKDHL